MTLDGSARRARRVAQRKDAILSAAMAVFAERGFERATTREIALAADVSEGTLYNYFTNKADLFLHIVERLAEAEHFEQSQADLPGDTHSMISAMLHTRHEFIRENFVAFKAVLAETLSNPELPGRYYRERLTPVLNHMQQHLDDEVASGRVRQMDTALASRMLLSLTLGSFVLLALGDPFVQQHWDDLPEALAPLLADGMHGPESMDS